jgi:hypothetical protein
MLKSSMAMLTLSLLGPFIAALDDQPLDNFQTSKVQALLIYLAVERQAPHRREHLMELLWPGMPLESAQVNLRQTLYRLRKTIPEVQDKQGAPLVSLLLTDRQTVWLNLDADQIAFCKPICFLKTVFDFGGKLFQVGDHLSQFGLLILFTNLLFGLVLEICETLSQTLDAGFEFLLFEVALSPEGRMLASTDQNEKVYLWDVDPNSNTYGQPLLTDADWNARGYRGLAFSPDGKFLAVGDFFGRIHLWNVDLAAWIDYTCGRAGRNLTSDEWDLYISWAGPYNPDHKTCPQWP